MEKAMAKATKQPERVKSIPATVTQPLHVAYRPKEWKDVIGQANAVKMLARMIETKKSQCYLLTGPSGTGKTTLARIAAMKWGCIPSGIIEIDAATRSGVDNVRELQEAARYRSFGSEGRAIILDEAHNLSRQSWEALLKVMEEPASFVVWFLCTTNPTKVPATIKTRATPIKLSEVKSKDLFNLGADVCDAESINVNDAVLDYICETAAGSPRQMLVYLEACREVKDVKEAKAIIHQDQSTDTTIALCRMLTQGGNWAQAMALVKKMEPGTYEGVRIVVSNYFGKVAQGAKNPTYALGVLGAFSQPYRQEEGLAPLMLSLGDVLFQRD